MRPMDNEKLTELSAALDAVNRGEQPDCRDEEIKELAAVAQLLKRSGPPPAVVAGLADTLSAELTARRKRRRLWLTSGVAGTAAAAVLVFALNTGPTAPPQPQMTVPPAGSVVIQTVPQQETATDKAGDARPAKPSAPAAKEAPAQKVKEAAPAPAPERPAAVAADNQQAKQRTMLAKPPDKTAERAADKAAGSFLVWPGHEPDTVTVDKDAGLVRQVYGSGDKQVVITQRPAGGAAAAARDGAAGAGAPEKANMVTVTIGAFVVTVEGNLPEEELQKIARSLN